MTLHDATLGEKYLAALPYLSPICMDPFSREGGSVNSNDNIMKSDIGKGDITKEMFLSGKILFSISICLFHCLCGRPRFGLWYPVKCIFVYLSSNIAGIGPSDRLGGTK